MKFHLITIFFDLSYIFYILNQIVRKKYSKKKRPSFFDLSYIFYILNQIIKNIVRKKVEVF